MRNKINILIVDDNPGFRKTLSDIFHNKGYVPIAVAQGADALMAFKNKTFQVAIIDLQLPDMDGLQLMRVIKRSFPDTECIVLSGHASLPSVIEAVNLGAYSYMRKPYDVEQLLINVRRAVEKQEAVDKLRVSEERMALAIEASEGGYFEHSTDFSQGNVSRQWAMVYGYALEELPPITDLFRWWQDQMHPEDHPSVAKIYHDLVEGRLEQYKIEFRIRHKSGAWRWIQATSRAVERDESGRATVIAGIQMDITDRKEVEYRLAYMATHDALTDLPNRTLFIDYLNWALAQAQRNQTPLAVLFLDLDKFKNVNDSLGHSVGDRLLKKVSERMGRLLRRSDSIARVGGDEFLLLLPEIGQDQDVIHVAQKILCSFQTPFSLDPHELSITVSIGIALYPEHGKDAESLIRNSDSAMYSAKVGGRNTYRLYEVSMYSLSPVKG